MFLADPGRTPYDVYFSVFGIPVRVHPLFWLGAILLGSSATQQEYGALRLLVWVGVVFFSILVHEMGHALMIRYFGFEPWIVLYTFGGFAAYHPDDNGKARRRRGHGTFAQVVIALAGPFAGFLLAGLVFAIMIGLAFAGLSSGGFIDGELSLSRLLLLELISDLLWVNIAWGLFNLLPIYPLDGGRVSRSLFVRFAPRNGLTWSLVLSMLCAGGIAVLGAYARDIYLMIMFLLFAVSNWQELQSFRGPTGYGGGYGGYRERDW